ncbi:MAG: RNase P subunit p30 family protein [Candidatus Thorarchaeota archaeon]
MPALDLGVNISNSNNLDLYIEMASRIGLTGLATQNIDDGPIKKMDDGFLVLKRFDVSGRGLNSIKKQVTSARKQSMIVSVPLTTIEIANWAAEESRVDLLTLDPSREHRFRDSTARLAVDSGTCLEIQFAPLLDSVGLSRSKIIKTFREAVHTAMSGGMPVVLSSGATHPLQMRSVMAMRYIGTLLGMTSKYTETAVCEVPFEILEKNQKKLNPDFVAEGVEIVQRGGNG